MKKKRVNCVGGSEVKGGEGRKKSQFQVGARRGGGGGCFFSSFGVSLFGGGGGDLPLVPRGNVVVFFFLKGEMAGGGGKGEGEGRWEG